MRATIRERGQSMIESTLVLVLFFGLLLGVIDCGQVLVRRQALEERVRDSVRWGTLHAWDGSGEAVANVVLYNHPAPPAHGELAFLALTRDNVQVRYQAATPEDPDGERLNVSIVNYQFELFAPLFRSASQAAANTRIASITAPMLYHASSTRTTVAR